MIITPTVISKQRLLLCVLFFVSALVYVFFMNYNGLYGQDSYSYLRFSKELKQFVSNSNPASGFYWPALYPLSGALLSYIFDPALSLQLVSVLSMTLVFYFLSKIIELLYGPLLPIHYTLAIAWLGSPYLFRMGISCMSDMQSILFAVMCFYFLIQFEKTKKQYMVWIASACAVVSLFTHFSSVILILPLAVIFLWRNFKSIKPVSYFYSALFTFAVAGIALYFNYDALTHITNDRLSGNWSFLNCYKRSYTAEVEGYHHHLLPNGAFVFSLFYNPGFGLTGLLVFISAYFMKIKLRVEIYSAACVLTGLLFFSGLPEQNTRHLALVYPFTLILFMPVFVELASVVSQKIMFYSLATLLLLNILLIPKAMNPFIKYNVTEKEIARYVKESGKGKLIYCMALTDLLKAYDVEARIFDLYNENILTVDSNALAIIDEQALKLQWRNKLPGKNYLVLKKYLGLKNPELILDNYSFYKLN